MRALLNKCNSYPPPPAAANEIRFEHLSMNFNLLAFDWMKISLKISVFVEIPSGWMSRLLSKQENVIGIPLKHIPTDRLDWRKYFHPKHRLNSPVSSNSETCVTRVEANKFFTFALTWLMKKSVRAESTCIFVCDHNLSDVCRPSHLARKWFHSYCPSHQKINFC